jgi:F-type H+-transporting ATPase subunit delta
MAKSAAHESTLDTGASRNRLARVYAESLLAVAEQKGQAQAVLDELDGFVTDVLAKSPSVAQFFSSPAINKKAKTPVLNQAFKGKVSDLFLNFLHCLNQNGRLGMVSQIRHAIHDLTDAKSNRIRVKVTSAVPLGAEQQDKIKQTLKAALQKEPVLTVAENPDLLGGLVVQFGDKVVDSSVRSRLDALRAALMTQGTSYVLQN